MDSKKQSFLEKNGMFNVPEWHFVLSPPKCGTTSATFTMSGALCGAKVLHGHYDSCIPHFFKVTDEDEMTWKKLLDWRMNDCPPTKERPMFWLTLYREPVSRTKSLFVELAERGPADLMPTVEAKKVSNFEEAKAFWLKWTPWFVSLMPKAIETGCKTFGLEKIGDLEYNSDEMFGVTKMDNNIIAIVTTLEHMKEFPTKLTSALAMHDRNAVVVPFKQVHQMEQDQSKNETLFSGLNDQGVIRAIYAADPHLEHFYGKERANAMLQSSLDKTLFL